ncbi:MAG: hypothetical protein FJX62_08640 [Alphaproteobacteria bacterium]|nr:hypothetical protein [Alphaproteobacteria bacterium]
MDRGVSLPAGFDAMRAFLHAQWEDGGRRSEDLAILLGSLDRGTAQDGAPADPAQWSDWIDAVLTVRPDLKGRIEDGGVTIGPGEAFEAMRAFLAAYWERGGRTERGIGEIAEALDRDRATAGLQQRWSAAVRMAQPRS